MYNLKASLTSSKVWIILAITVAAATTAWLAGAQVSIPRIQLSTDSLYAPSNGEKPAITLALSVEFPTVGAQYTASSNSDIDSSYANTKEYLGYYDAESCYTYNNSPTESPTSGLTTADYKRFDISGAATSRMCSNAFSGNFLNWASSSAIDMLRLALSGGDRYIDTTTLTVLQRAVLPNGDPSCFWNSGNFPAKQLQKNGDSPGKYWGAVPTSMAAQAGGNDIWIANTLNRIYFGTTKTGCNDTTSYTLGAASAARSVGPVTNSASPLPADAISCATEGGDCSFTGVHEVWFGASMTSSGGGGNAFGNDKKNGAVTVYYWAVAPASSGVACNNKVFGDPIDGIPKSCFYRTGNYTGPWTPPPAAGASLNTDGFFYSRVQVCNVSAGTLTDNRDYKLCTRYPNGTYKPTGTIQKYSDQLRLAAFGYLIDQTQSAAGGRYGGVLRAPMKFVGSKTFDNSGQEDTPSTGNPKAEWDAITGIFAKNPDNDTTQANPISGVINYLNKFGRTGPVLGRYKLYDPVGELHGESLRYLQGLQPTAAAVSNITTEMYDGFPVYTTWQDPYGGARTAAADYSCLKSNIVMIGDINTGDSLRMFTRTPDVSNNLPDMSYWSGIVANFESNTNSSYIDGQGTTRTTSNPNSPNTNQIGVNNYQPLIASAYWARTHDIRGADWTAGNGPLLQRRGLRVKSYFFDVNEYTNSYNLDGNGVPTATSTYYRQNQNQFFTSAKYGGFEADASNLGARPYNTYGNPFKKQDGTNENNVWQDSLRPGEASSYYLQSNARGVLQAFDSIFLKSAVSARSIAGSSVASKDITSAGTLVYNASFDSSNWAGDVLAFPVSAASGTATVSTTPTWKASTQLNSMVLPAVNRKIFVGSSGASANPVAKAFSWATIDQSLKDNLAKLSPASIPDSAAIAEKRLNYLRGDTSESQFRNRTQLLGDILNSGVVYSGAPVAPTRVTAGFAAFQTLYASRAPAVFAGANDGMLHAFNAATGNELFGYIPSSMGSKLAALTAPSYNGNHQLYVDATPVVAEAKVGQGDTAADWKTVLVSGMGGGATGVFALDVSDPSTFSAGNALWEFTRADDADMGFVVGTPRIITLRTSAPASSTPTFRSFVAVASGVNNYVTENSISGGAGNPALFLLALDKQAGSPWIPSDNYFKITVPVDSTSSATNATGLINFKPLLGFNGVTEKIYMGDLHGKVWKLDFASINVTGPMDWNMGKLSSFNSGSTGSPVPYPLYVAKTAAGALQPITMAPLLAAGPVTAGLATTIVGFGTGKYMEAGDKTSTFQNSFYAVFDNGTPTSDGGGTVNGAISSRSRLQPGSADVNTLKVTVAAFKFGRATTNTPVGTPPLRSGWYFDFPVSGERIISSGSILGNNFLLSSLIPVSAGAVGSCTAGGGSGNSYELNIDSGNGGFEKSTVGLLGETLMLKVSEVNDTSDSAGKGIKTTAYQKIRIGSSGSSVSADKLTDSVFNRRLTWRQINNFQDLKRGK